MAVPRNREIRPYFSPLVYPEATPYSFKVRVVSVSGSAARAPRAGVYGVDGKSKYAVKLVPPNAKPWEHRFMWSQLIDFVLQQERAIELAAAFLLGSGSWGIVSTAIRAAHRRRSRQGRTPPPEAETATPSRGAQGGGEEASVPDLSAPVQDEAFEPELPRAKVLPAGRPLPDKRGAGGRGCATACRARPARSGKVLPRSSPSASSTLRCSTIWRTC